MVLKAIKRKVPMSRNTKYLRKQIILIKAVFYQLHTKTEIGRLGRQKAQNTEQITVCRARPGSLV